MARASQPAIAMSESFRLAVVGALVLAAVKCGGDSPATAPPAPSPSPTGNYTVTGLVEDLPGGRPIANTTISVTSGLNMSRTAATGADGQYSLTGLVAGTANVSLTSRMVTGHPAGATTKS